MKNIHILPTDKPSNITNRTKTNELMYSYKLFSSKNGKDINVNQHIYITSDEEIKEGDWVIFKGEDGRDRLMRIKEYCWTTDERKIYKMAGGGLTGQDMSKKIILTTDQDLIKDGIQEIPDEFLEWWIKNLSCDEIKVEKISVMNNRFKLGYKIIIPKEEQKQKTLEGKFQSWNELVKEVGSEEELLEILKLPHISTLVREAMRSNCKNK